MRLLLFFDLPMETPKERFQYNRFRKFLIKEGFIMVQKSVYVKLALNMTAVTLIKNKIESKLPNDGLIHVLTVTEKQFSAMEAILGEVHHNNLDSTERLVIL